MAATPATPSELRACPGCGLFQVVPSLVPGMAARCRRCETVLRRARTDPLTRGLALSVTALALLAIMATTILMTVSTTGIVHGAGLFAGPAELVRRDMPELAAVVVFTSLIAPVGKHACVAYVLLRLRSPAPPAHLRRVFVLAERLAPWAMIDVLVFGVFVAYVKLADLVHITLGTGVYALLALTVVIAWANTALDRHAVWEAIEAADPVLRPAVGRRVRPNAIGCETCGLVSEPEAAHAQCPRCHSTLHARKPDSVARTWALVIAAAVMYVPANYYPVLTVIQLGRGAPSTIVGGVLELLDAAQYPLAALVFLASIAVPMLKLVGLAFMLASVQLHSAGRLRGRTRLYYFVSVIGRWSMIDIYMESLLGALVRFGALVTIQPGAGAVAFCAVVILTMLAAETFDPRLMWDAAETARAGRPAARPLQRPSRAARLPQQSWTGHAIMRFVANAAAVGVLAWLAACTISPPPPATTVPPIPPSPFDGFYRGAVRPTTTSAGSNVTWCETTGPLTLTVASATFRLALPHPNVPGNPTVVFEANIAPDGSFETPSQDGTASITGQLTGGRLQATINGAGCAYALAADKV